MTIVRRTGVNARFALMSALIVASSGTPALTAMAGDADLARQTQNPIAALISVPLQLNYDDKIGPGEQGEKWQLNVQPVIPVAIDADWNVISRTIVPLVSQEDVLAGARTDAGIGDVTQSFFFSPVTPAAGGWIWGAGPALLLPTGSEDRLTADKWGLGPTAVVLRQQDGWTYGALANHIWSIAGDDHRSDVSATFLQPFLSYTTGTHTSFGVNTEATYDWKSDQWSVPINVAVTQLLKVGNQPVSLQAGVRYWADSPNDAGPRGWGFRLTATLLFPR